MATKKKFSLLITTEGKNKLYLDSGEINFLFSSQQGKINSHF